MKPDPSFYDGLMFGADVPTRNNSFYTKEALQGAIEAYGKKNPVVPVIIDNMAPMTSMANDPKRCHILLLRQHLESPNSLSRDDIIDMAEASRNQFFDLDWLEKDEWNQGRLPRGLYDQIKATEIAIGQVPSLLDDTILEDAVFAISCECQLSEKSIIQKLNSVRQSPVVQYPPVDVMEERLKAMNKQELASFLGVDPDVYSVIDFKGVSVLNGQMQVDCNMILRQSVQNIQIDINLSAPEDDDE